MTSWRFKWFQSVGWFQTNCALAQLFKADYKYISIILFNYYAADGGFLDLYFKSVQENSVHKEPYVLKEKWKANLN